MHVDIKKAASYRLNRHQSGLLFHLAHSRLEHILIFGFNVSARLEPAMQFSMENQKEGVGGRGEDKGACCKVTWKEVVAGEAARAGFEQFEHGGSETCFSLVSGLMVSEEFPEVIVAFHAQDVAVSPIEGEPLVMEPV